MDEEMKHTEQNGAQCPQDCGAPPTDSTGAGELSRLREHIWPEEDGLPVSEPDAPAWAYQDGLAAFCFSQQGEVHIKNGTPCQDRSGLRQLKAAKLLLCAVADGVGSCVLSHYGAARAVQTALDELAARLEPSGGLEPPCFQNPGHMGELLRHTFRTALDAVDKLAVDMGQLPASFHTTLTVAVYDGETLYFGHAGDDGIVALCGDGSYEMVTSRHKGSQTGSVYPLQSETTWQFGRVTKPVTAFAMMTDGVLDAIVGEEAHHNRVYFPFLRPAFLDLMDSQKEVQLACMDWYAYLQSPSYREKVTDDLTLAVVTNQNCVRNGVFPVFDQERWNQETKQIQEKIGRSIHATRFSECKPWPSEKNGCQPVPKTRSYPSWDRSRELTGQLAKNAAKGASRGMAAVGGAFLLIGGVLYYLGAERQERPPYDSFPPKRENGHK